MNACISDMVGSGRQLDVDRGQHDSVHVEVALENPLLKVVRLLGCPWPGRLGRRSGHIGHRLGAVMVARADLGRRRSSARGGGTKARSKRERGPGVRGDGAFSTRPKLIGPVEALV